MQRMVVCKTCGLVQRLEELPPRTVARCARCDSKLGGHGGNSLSRTAAFALAALVFYVPANIYPVLEKELYGAHSESTVWDGCVTLFALVKLGELATVLLPGPGLIAFTAVVVLTILASMSFDPTRIWEPRDSGRSGESAFTDTLPKANQELGRTITIRFTDATGVRAGQTEIRYRGVPLGRVVTVELSDDDRYAEVKARLRREASAIAKEGSVFWIVRPELRFGDISRLSTIVSGPYSQVARREKCRRRADAITARSLVPKGGF